MTSTRAIEELQSSMSVLVDRYAFAEIEPRLWTRRWGWKADVIRLTAKPQADPWLVEVSIEVFIPIRVLGDYGQMIGGANLGSLSGRQYGDYRVSRGFLGVARGIDRLLHDFKGAISWFEAYETPTKCIQRREVDPNMPIGSRAHLESVAYLERMARAIDVPACTVQCPIDVQDAKMLRWFVPL